MTSENQNHKGLDMKLDSRAYTAVDLLDLILFDMVHGTNTAESLFDTLETKALNTHHEVIDRIDFLIEYINRLGDTQESLDDFIMESYTKQLKKSK